MRSLIALPLAVCLLLAPRGAPLRASAAESVSADPYAGETRDQRDARMAWWREARFGMFIHWGVYSVPAGIYKGKPVDGIGEWIMFNGRIPVSEYRQFARQFNPVKYDPDAWVRLAKEAGMQYLVITSKHHDGFALFDSKATDWDVVDATPYGKDLLKPLAEACRRHGLKLGFYYSQAQDWNHPGGGICGDSWDPAQKGDMDAYIRDIAVPQVREILSNYGPISVLWWDTPCGMDQAKADQLLPLARLQPGLILNNRLGGPYRGDTETPEQFVPATGYPNRDWETCMTMNDTWGFKSDDHNWKDARTLIRNLVDIASKGGNYLLNVGPTAEGLFPEPSVERLKAVGRWMNVSRDAIYGTSASPFKRLPWGRCTRKSDTKGTLLYLAVFDWPENGLLFVPGLHNDILAANILGDRRRHLLPVERSTEGVTVRLEAKAPDSDCPIVVLRIKGDLDVTPIQLTQAADGRLLLPAAEAVLHGDQLQYESGQEHDNIGFWLNAGDWVEWPVNITRAGTFTVTARIAALGAGRFTVSAGTQRLDGTAPITGNYGKFESVRLGTVRIPEAGPVTIQVRPVADGWQPMNLKDLVLSPVP